MTTIEAIERIEEMEQRLAQLRHAMNCEREDIQEQWAVLGNLGGQREDHAAQLLSRLRPHLRGIAEFASDCEKQIDGYVADPFGRRVTA